MSNEPDQTRLILIVDDEEDIREVAQVSLEVVAGWRVLTASCGADGVEVALDTRPDAILLDVMMPGWDGPTTFEHLQAQPTTKSLPVIFLTASVQTANRQTLLGLGPAGILAKPFDPMTLARSVADILGWALQG